LYLVNSLQKVISGTPYGTVAKLIKQGFMSSSI